MVFERLVEHFLYRFCVALFLFFLVLLLLRRCQSILLKVEPAAFPYLLVIFLSFLLSELSFLLVSLLEILLQFPSFSPVSLTLLLLLLFSFDVSVLLFYTFFLQEVLFLLSFLQESLISFLLHFLLSWA